MAANKPAFVNTISQDKPAFRNALDSQHAVAASPMQAQAQANPSTIDYIADSAPVNFVLGAGDALGRQYADVANLIPGVNLHVQDKGEGLAYKAGDVAGNLAGYTMGGEALGAARGLAEGLPLAGKLATALGKSGFKSGLARRAIGGGLYGAVTNPDNRTLGATLGAGLSAGGDILTAGAGKAINAVSPGKVVKKIQDILSPASIKSRKSAGGSLYDEVFDSLPEYHNIYSPVENTSMVRLDEAGPRGIETYNDLTSGFTKPTIDKLYPYKTKLMHNKFMENPTARNAHELQSQLGKDIGKYDLMEIKLGTLPQAERNLKDVYSIARDTIKNDLKGYLAKQDPALVNKYENAKQFWREKVDPYRRASLAISSLRRNPTSEKILTKLNKLEDKAADFEERTGRKAYFPEEISNYLPELSEKIQRRDLTQKGLGIMAGGALGGHFSPGVEMMGGALGMYAAPKIAQLLRPLTPKGKAMNTLANLLKGISVSQTADMGQ